MKRKGVVLDDEPDKKKSASSTVTEDTSNLTDFVDEILVQVYSFLGLKERQVARRVCQRLLDFVDTSTPGADEFWIELRDTRSDQVLMRQARTNPNKICLRVGGLARQTEEEKDKLSMLRTILPPLRSIRPKEVCIESSIFDERGGLVAAVMLYLLEQQVARSVTSIQFYLPSSILDEPLPDFQQACLNFDQASHSGVQSLVLRSCNPPPLSIPLALTRLQSIVSGLHILVGSR